MSTAQPRSRTRARHGEGVANRQKGQRAYGLLVVLLDGEAGELLQVEVVLVRRHVLDAAGQRHGLLPLLCVAVAGGRYGEGKQHEQGSHEWDDSMFAHLDWANWGRNL